LLPAILAKPLMLNPRGRQRVCSMKEGERQCGWYPELGELPKGGVGSAARGYILWDEFPVFDWCA
jgi:hypothetical protein